MPSTQVRITKTKELQKVLDFLKSEYIALSEAEIFKKFLVEGYANYRKNDRIKSRSMNFDDEYDDDITPEELLMQASHVFGVSSKDDDDVGFADLDNLKPIDFSDYV